MDQPICAIDCEGDWGERGLLGVAFYSDRVQRYSTRINEIDGLLREHADNGYLLLAHNAEYELSVIFWQLGYKARAIYNNGRFNHAEIWLSKDGKPTHMWDTYGLSGGLSVKSLGKALNMPKYATPKHLLTGGETSEDWYCERHKVYQCEECYAIRDAEICHHYFQTLTAFLRDYNLEPRRTIGSIATNLWQVLDVPADVPINSKRIEELSRLSYHGGRTEVFKYGHIDNVFTADVTSMYPAMMLQQPMPDMSSIIYVDRERISDKVLDYEGACEATVYVPEMYVPPLPTEYAGKLYFPIGCLRGVWCHNELRAAILRGCRVEKIHRTTYGKRNCYPFQRYVNTLYELRAKYKAADDPRQLTVKIILNSLYGRLGLGKDQEQEQMEIAPLYSSSSDYEGYTIQVEQGRIYAIKKKVFSAASTTSNVLWASIITAAARVTLLGYLEQQGHNLIYCDTDSVYSMAPITTEDDGLGKLAKPEWYTKGDFYGPKLYRLTATEGGKTLRAKGVPQRVADDYLTYGEATFDAPVRPREAFIRNDTPGRWRKLTKYQGLVPAKRTILNPDSLYRVGGFSETMPVVFVRDALTDGSALDDGCEEA